VSDDFSGDNIGRAASLQRRRAVVPQAMKAKSATLPPSIATGTFLFISPRFDDSRTGHESVEFVRKPGFFLERNAKALGNSGVPAPSFLGSQENKRTRERRPGSPFRAQFSRW
jgi:hypothetical protein